MKFGFLLDGLFIIACIGTVRSIRNIDGELFELSVIHLNDFHARFEETSRTSTRCTDGNCIGGFSRIYTAVHSLVQSRPNAIFLNAGDNFQGTYWYNVHRWNVTSHFLNKLPTDAYTLGNHEFDDKLKGVIPFVKSLEAPVVVSNIDDSLEPEFQGIYKKSTVIFRGGRKIGIIGAILSSTNEITSTEKLKFLDEVTSINREAKRLVDYENCSIIIVLSHCGIDVDKKIAQSAGPHVNLVVGGHTHTFLYTGLPPGPEKPSGPYPVVVSRTNGRKVLVVQASLNSKYLGNLTVWYNTNGDVVNWEGNPIYLDHRVKQDPEINAEIDEWKKSVDAFGNTILGSSLVLLDQSTRRSGESNIGSFFTDAMVDYYVQYAEDGAWTYAAIAIINSGGIRASIMPGKITYNDLVTSQPFENTIDVGELSGKIIKDFLEYSVTPSVIRKYQFHEFLQVSGIRVKFDTTKPVGSRVKRVKLRCSNCPVPSYAPLNLSETYRIILPSFIANGGDGYTMIKDNLRNRQIGETDVDIYRRYIKKMSPVTQGLDERIILNDADAIHDLLEFNSSVTLESNNFLSVFCCTFSILFCYNLNVLYTKY